MKFLVNSHRILSVIDKIILKGWINIMQLQFTHRSIYSKTMTRDKSMRDWFLGRKKKDNL